MKPVLVKLTELNKYIMENYKDKDNHIEVLHEIQEKIWQVWDIITLELHIIEREREYNAINK